MNQRLRPAQRIRKKQEFQNLFKKGKFARGKLLNLWVARDAARTAPAIGITVSRKTDSRATGRNLWKRRIREAFRRTQNRLKENLSFLFQSRLQEKTPAYAEILEDMENLFKQTGSFK